MMGGMPARPGGGGKTQMNQLPQFSTQQNFAMARALYDCVAEEPDEISFSAGEILQVIDQSNAEWVVVRKTDSGGMGLQTGEKVMIGCGWEEGRDSSSFSLSGRAF